MSSLLHRHHNHKDAKEEVHDGRHHDTIPTTVEGFGNAHSPTPATTTTTTTMPAGTTGSATGTHGTAASAMGSRHADHHTNVHRVDEVPVSEAAKPHVLPDEHGHKKLHKDPPAGAI